MQRVVPVSEQPVGFMAGVSTLRVSEAGRRWQALQGIDKRLAAVVVLLEINQSSRRSGIPIDS